MSVIKSGAKGLVLEEVLKSYFSKAGYLAIRGVPYRVDGDEITDIDLWLYERPAASTRRRLIVDIKNKKSPKAAERIIWAKGLQSAIGVDTAIVASPTTSTNIKRLAKTIGVVLLDGEAISKLMQSDLARDQSSISLDTLQISIRAVDSARRSNDWKEYFDKARTSLVSGFGSQSANQNLSAGAFFAEQAVMAADDSDAAETAVRLVYFTSALALISLDYVVADYAFQSQDDRRQIVIDGLRFGQSDLLPAVATVKTAIALARQYAENGNAVARQIEMGFYADADRIPAEIIADHIARMGSRDTAFSIARELEAASMAANLTPFDALSMEAKSFLAVLLDFNGIAREKVAAASLKSASVKQRGGPKKQGKIEDGGPLFSKSGS